MVKAPIRVAAKVCGTKNKGIAPNKRVTVLIDESLEDVAERARREAARRRLTPEGYDEIMKSLS